MKVLITSFLFLIALPAFAGDCRIESRFSKNSRFATMPQGQIPPKILKAANFHACVKLAEKEYLSHEDRLQQDNINSIFTKATYGAHKDRGALTLDALSVVFDGSDDTSEVKKSCYGSFAYQLLKIHEIPAVNTSGDYEECLRNIGQRMVDAAEFSPKSRLGRIHTYTTSPQTGSVIEVFFGAPNFADLKQELKSF